MPINFFNESLPSEIILVPHTSEWLHQIAKLHQCIIKEINYIFCTDDYLHSINMEYLSHDTYTDIITFDHSEQSSQPEGDIFISVERVRENAAKFQCTPEDELYRVIAHGLLHLLGFKDKTEEEKQLMRGKEEACLSLLADFNKNTGVPRGTPEDE